MTSDGDGGQALAEQQAKSRGFHTARRDPVTGRRQSAGPQPPSAIRGRMRIQNTSIQEGQQACRT